jgi:L-ascorbate metabolism protein UlaG (beta-lactamase superfamily)
LIQVAGINILTDPMFSERASPFSFMGPKRKVPLPLRQDDLPPIQATIISHNHYDHLDAATIAKLGNTVKFFVPLGMSNWFREMGLDNVTELDWWQSASLGPIRVHCVPAQHFSIRTFFDANKTLCPAGIGRLSVVFLPASVLLLISRKLAKGLVPYDFPLFLSAVTCPAGL